ncbi:MAG: DUF1961 family protein [Planctomycetota bacterium]
MTTIATCSLPLDGHFRLATGNEASIEGEHRFLLIDGKRGYQALSQKTRLRVPCDLHLGERGTMSLWLAPLEDLGVSGPLSYVTSKSPNWQQYGLVSDAWPTNDIAQSTFAWYWQSFWHPQMIAKFMRGSAGGVAANYAVTPYVPVEHLPLHARTWYHLAFTWDKPACRFRIYVNGVLAGTTVYPFACQEPQRDLYLGNTAMVFADFLVEATEHPAATLAQRYQAAQITHDPRIANELTALFSPQPPTAITWTPDPNWSLRYERALTKPGDFDGWKQQGCMKPPFALKALECTPDGLLIQTPDEVDNETRVYFWSPDIFEGDLAVSYDFRPEQDTGLALLVVQASGMQREDFLTDHPPRTSGNMGTIIGDQVRNYHWEFFRHAVDVRGDLGTQVLIKNPWQRPLGMSSLPPITVGAWHRLLFLQEGRRIRIAIDGNVALDVLDDPWTNTGPVLTRGRIGLRLMYATRMRFRNVKIWNREPLPEF